MAIYHLSAIAISRSTGRSACAAAAYRAAEKITDERTGITHDFTRKGGVLYSEIIAPAGSPTWATTRTELWNRAEQAEDTSTRRATATTAREFNIALPHELDSDAQLALVREFAHYIVTTYGVAVDFSIHEPGKDGDERNYHVHFMLTDRRLTDIGFTVKVRELNIFNGGKANIASIREQWAEIANRILERAGVREGIDHRSYKSQCIDREATTHLGVAATALERRGVATERGNRNRAAHEINALREEFEEAGETMRAQELAENYEDKEAAKIEAKEKADAATLIEGITATRSTFTTQDVDAAIRRVVSDSAQGTDKATSAGGIDQADMSGRSPDSRRKAVALPEQYKFDQQNDTETPQPSATEMTHEERIKEAETKAKASKERRRMLERDHPRPGRGR